MSSWQNSFSGSLKKQQHKYFFHQLRFVMKGFFFSSIWVSTELQLLMRVLVLVPGKEVPVLEMFSVFLLVYLCSFCCLSLQSQLCSSLFLFKCGLLETGAVQRQGSCSHITHRLLSQIRSDEFDALRGALPVGTSCVFPEDDAACYFDAKAENTSHSLLSGSFFFWQYSGALVFLQISLKGSPTRQYSSSLKTSSTVR